mgnify:CR=1 FL=1
MTTRGKNYTKALVNVDRTHRYGLDEAVSMALDAAFAKFDETVDVAVKLGVNPRHADQMVRGTVVLPNGTGRTERVLVFAKGEKEREAKDAGADYVGADDLVEKIKGGWMEFDRAVATPDMMGSVGKIGKILGPRGLMPNAKVGTVTFDVARAVREIKAGKVEFRVDKAGVVHAPMGKVSFGVEKLRANIASFFETIMRLKPASAKGVYVRSVAISTTMGPGFKVEPSSIKAVS